MDRSSVISLISETQTQDAYGVIRTTETSTDVYANVQSVTANEFFEGGRNGLNPEYRFTLFYGDYDGQTKVTYNGNNYAVYRTYQARTDIIELYCERKGGTNG